jgi:prolipoprotein diacylglyceryltransferase
VQLYESLAMVAFLAWFVPRLKRGEATAIRSGFYLFAGWYAAQRFLWEFLKPYPAVIGPFNLFHLVCLAVLVYAAAMLVFTREAARAPA